jgi:hypothetical protein
MEGVTAINWKSHSGIYLAAVFTQKARSSYLVNKVIFNDFVQQIDRRGE